MPDFVRFAHRSNRESSARSIEPGDAPRLDVRTITPGVLARTNVEPGAARGYDWFVERALLLDVMPVARTAADGRGSPWDAMLLFGALVLGMLLGGVLLMYFRRRLQPFPEERQPLFDPAELRRLRDEGELTIAEYEALKDRTIEAMRDSLVPSTPPPRS
jgi:hypothetical protein